eukprot:1016659_1
MYQFIDKKSKLFLRIMHISHGNMWKDCISAWNDVVVSNVSLVWNKHSIACDSNRAMLYLDASSQITNQNSQFFINYGRLMDHKVSSLTVTSTELDSHNDIPDVLHIFIFNLYIQILYNA